MLAGMNGDVRRDGRARAPSGPRRSCWRGTCPARGVGVCCARSAPAGPAPSAASGPTPRRARCADCQVTQILLPTALIVRRADSTEAIGNALVAHARGAGHRSIAARFGRPESTVRRWLRGIRDPHAQWLYRRAVDRAVAIDR